jgi:hypothetical protein
MQNDVCLQEIYYIAYLRHLSGIYTVYRISCTLDFKWVSEWLWKTHSLCSYEMKMSYQLLKIFLVFCVILSHCLIQAQLTCPIPSPPSSISHQYGTFVVTINIHPKTWRNLASGCDTVKNGRNLPSFGENLGIFYQSERHPIPGDSIV